ncbi:MAG: hypothetical protein ABF811_02110 [Pseudoclavibacter sp.]
MSTETERTGRRLPWRAAPPVLAVCMRGGYLRAPAAASWATGGAMSGAETTAPWPTT